MPSKRILLVEDDQTVRKAIGLLLGFKGYTVLPVEDGEDAWEILNLGEQFNLIISDKDMQGMNGLELLRKVRTDSRTADIPFLLMSGDTTVSWEDQTPLEAVCANLGAEFLEKPFSCIPVVAQLLGDT